MQKMSTISKEMKRGEREKRDSTKGIREQMCGWRLGGIGGLSAYGVGKKRDVK